MPEQDPVSDHHAQPDAAEHLRRGMAYLHRQEHAQAIAHLTRALSLDPENADAYLQRGNAHISVGDLERAIADFTEVLRRQPDTVEAHHNRGVAHAQREEFDQALSDFNEVIRLKPDAALAYQSRGNAEGDMGQFDQAIADFTEARWNRAIPTPTCGAGWPTPASATWNRLLADYTEAIHRRPQYATAYFYRGRAFAVLGDHNQTIADLTTVLRLDSTLPGAFCSRAGVCRSGGLRSGPGRFRRSPAAQSAGRRSLARARPAARPPGRF